MSLGFPYKEDTSLSNFVSFNNANEFSSEFRNGGNNQNSNSFIPINKTESSNHFYGSNNASVINPYNRPRNYSFTTTDTNLSGRTLTGQSVNSAFSHNIVTESNRSNYNDRKSPKSSKSPYDHIYSQRAEPDRSYMSAIEAAILRSTVPIELNETEEITIQGQRGIWANKNEVVNWRGEMPISAYTINEDNNPEVITKRTHQNIEYLQELAVRYLKPPTPPPPGEIVITQEANILTPPAPPLVIRQQPARPSTPEPLVIREAPPKPPLQVGRKVITISGKRLPPPPRKVVIERLAPLPSKPQGVMIERWLPYSEVKRRVIFQKSNQIDPVVIKPRNVIIQWEAPQVTIKKDFKYLGVIRANPYEYVQRYGSTLKQPNQLPDFVLDIKPPQGIVLAADYQYNQVHELEGEVSALRLVDLDKEGLSEYKPQLQKFIINNDGSNEASSGFRNYISNNFNNSSSINDNDFIKNNSNNYDSFDSSYTSAGHYTASSYSNSNSSGNLAAIISDLFNRVDRDRNGRISIEEAEKLLLRINSRLGRRYGENDVRAFVQALDRNRNGTIELDEFKIAFERLL